jgi:hypothetical protein
VRPQAILPVMIALMKFPERAVSGGDPINELVERQKWMNKNLVRRRSPHRKDAQKQKQVLLEKKLIVFHFDLFSTQK